MRLSVKQKLNVILLCRFLSQNPLKKWSTSLRGRGTERSRKMAAAEHGRGAEGPDDADTREWRVFCHPPVAIFDTKPEYLFRNRQDRTAVD